MLYRLSLIVALIVPLSSCDDDSPGPAADADGDGDTDGDSDGDGDGDGEGDGDGDVDSDADGDADGDADSDIDADADSDADEVMADGDVDDDPIEDRELRLMTWNLENFPTAASTVATVAELIEDLDVDIVGVQEINEVEAFEELVLSMPGYDGALANDPGAYSWVGLIWRTTRVEATGIETLFDDDWYAFPRPPILAHFAVTDGAGTTIFDLQVMVLHLKAQLDDESRARRRAACEQLEVWTSEQILAGGDPDIALIGDWNDELTDWGTHLVFEVFLEEPDQYTFLTLDLAEAGGFTYIPFESFLDHVMVTNDALDEYGAGTTEVLELELTVPDYEDTVSDHRPVLSTFEIP